MAPNFKFSIMLSAITIAVASCSLAWAEVPQKRDVFLTLDRQAPATTGVSNLFVGRGDGVTTCPVTGEKITGSQFQGKFHGRDVRFCCAGCLHRAQQEPDKYIQPTLAAQRSAVQTYVSSSKGSQDPEAAAKEAAEMCSE